MAGVIAFFVCAIATAAVLGIVLILTSGAY